MDWKVAVDLIGTLVWPVTLLCVAFVFRENIAKFIDRIKTVKGPGGTEIHTAVDRLVKQVEALSVDIYNLSGEALAVREEIWSYIAEILDHVTENTSFEMRKELTLRHLPEPEVAITPTQAKEMLWRLKCLAKTPSEEKKGFTDEITRGLIDGAYKFQKKYDFAYADGVIGPKTAKRLREELSLLDADQQNAEAI